MKKNNRGDNIIQTPNRYKQTNQKKKKNREIVIYFTELQLFLKFGKDVPLSCKEDYLEGTLLVVEWLPSVSNIEGTCW